MGISDLFKKRDQICTGLLNQSACSNRLIQRIPVKSGVDVTGDQKDQEKEGDPTGRDPTGRDPTGRDPTGSDPIDREGTSGQKWLFSLILGLFFLIISSPPAYYITGKIVTSLGGMVISSGGPTFPGLLLHTTVFIFLVRLLLW